jgi:hypothetical protein
VMTSADHQKPEVLSRSRRPCFVISTAGTISVRRKEGARLSD